MGIYDLMNKCNNYFTINYEQGEFTIVNNEVKVNGKYKVGQYIRIVDSLFNDNVYKIISVDNDIIKLDGVNDEVFNGYICGLNVPKDFIELVDKINDYENRIKKGISSESIPNYSISYSNEDYSVAFSNELSKYNKPYRGKYAWLKMMDTK